MAVRTDVPLRTASRIRKAVENITNSAQDDLMNAISCAMAAVDSDRAQFLSETGNEYAKNAFRKLELALELARLTATSVPSSGHGQREGQEVTAVDPGPVVEG